MQMALPGPLSELVARYLQDLGKHGWGEGRRRKAISDFRSRPPPLAGVAQSFFFFFFLVLHREALQGSNFAPRGGPGEMEALRNRFS